MRRGPEGDDKGTPMKPVHWYHAHEKQQFGPVSTAELKQLAQTGTLQPGDYVWREGLTGWVAAREVKGLFDDQGATPSGSVPVGLSPTSMPPPTAVKNGGLPAATLSPAPQMPSVDRHLLDPFLDYARRQFSPQFIHSASRLFTTVGHCALYGIMLTVVIFFTAIGLQTKDLPQVLIGLGATLLLASLQYTATRFLNLFEQFRRRGECQLSSTALPDGFALLSIAVGVTAVIGLTLQALDRNNFWIALGGLGAFILGEYAAFVALNPTWLGITVMPRVRPGEEAIGSLTFLLKTGLCCVPVLFGVQMALALLVLLHACYLVFTGTAEIAQAQALIATLLALLSAALPFAAYFAFVIGSMAVDVLRGLMVVANGPPAQVPGLNVEPRTTNGIR